MATNSPIASLPPGAAAQAAASVADSLLRPPRLLPGEKPSAYKRLRAQILGDLQPKGILETILVRDVIDYEWDVLRLHRLKTALLRARAHEGVRDVLEPFGDEDDDDFAALPNRWAAGESDARDEVEQLLRPAGLGLDEIMAATFEQNLATVERIDRLITSAEWRRNNALGQIDHRRQSLGAAVRAAVRQIEDTEFKKIGGEGPAEAVQ
jgi:hypothetical protein